MKKITAIVLAVMMVFALCACGGGDNLTFVTGGEQGTYYAFGYVKRLSRKIYRIFETIKITKKEIQTWVKYFQKRTKRCF